MSVLNNVLSRLDKVQRIGNNKYKSRCPAHDDRSPSLAIKDDDGRLLLHCFGGCQTIHVLAVIVRDFSDIMPDKLSGNFKKDRKPFYAMDVIHILKHEATLAYVYASDMANGLTLTNADRERLLLTTSRINHGFEVAKNGK